MASRRPDGGNDEGGSGEGPAGPSGRLRPYDPAEANDALRDAGGEARSGAAADEAPPPRTASLDEDVAERLATVVQMEAHRVLSASAIAPDPKRIAEGWERRFIADAARAEEAVALYEELGFEVVADPVRPDEMTDDCEDCRLLAMLKFKSIYTRRR